MASPKGSSAKTRRRWKRLVLSALMVNVGVAGWLFAGATCAFLMGGPCRRCNAFANPAECRVPYFETLLAFALVIGGVFVGAWGCLPRRRRK